MFSRSRHTKPLGFDYTLDTLTAVSLPKSPYTQVSGPERALLLLLGQHTVTGAGAAVDLGAGAGGSTLALCAGLRQNPSFAGKVHAFDYFRTGRGTFATEKFHTDPGASDDPSFLEDFKDNLTEYSDMLEVHSGNICELDLSGLGEIELLHVDIAKSRNTFGCVVRDFFPRLIPRTSIVLHQDFAGPRLAWLHYSTGVLLPYIKLFPCAVKSTLPFRLIRPIPKKLLKRLEKDAFTPDEKIGYIGQVQERVGTDITGTVPFGPILQLAKAFVRFYAGQHKEAWKIAEPLREDPYLARTRTDHFDQIERALSAQ
jgi:Methyltransferase domain